MPWHLLSVDIMFRKKALHNTPFASYFYRTRTMRSLPFRKHRLFWHTSQRKGYKYHNKNFGQSLKGTLLKSLVFCSFGLSNNWSVRFLRWHIFTCLLEWTVKQWLPLQWRHNGHDSVSNHQPHDCLLNRVFRRRSKKTSKLRVTGLCAGNSPGTGEFPAQMASYAENVSIWWRHHVLTHLVYFTWHVITYPWWDPDGIKVNLC